MRGKFVACGALALALVATFVTGAHHQLFTAPVKRTALQKPLPTVSPSALERGCAAWGEALPDCLEGTDPEPYRFDAPAKF
jgi:hypothetical protein